MTSLFYAFARLERHAVATVVLNVRKDLPDPVMLLRVLAPVLKSVAVFCIGVELRNGIVECGRCRENSFESAGAYVNLF